jgi:septal ring factor EnvC (AmiA/AmiB activator)
MLHCQCPATLHQHTGAVWCSVIMAQPNFATIHQALVELTHELDLFPNLPALNQPQINQNIQQLNQNLQQQNQNFQQLLQEFAQFREQTNQNFIQVNQKLMRINQRLQTM